MVGNRKYPYKANPNFIRSPKNPNWPADVRELLPMLGIKGNRLPDEGVPVQFLQGNIAVWVEPKADKQSFIRTRALCPVCFKGVAASRLIQHKCRPQPVHSVLP